jgi:hypothetical protein
MYAIFAFKAAVNYFVNSGICVYLTALDESNAFDSMNLYKSLLNAGLPLKVY